MGNELDEIEAQYKERKFKSASKYQGGTENKI